MKNQIIINKVKIVKLKSGKLEFHVPTNMSGNEFKKFKEANRSEIENFKDDTTINICLVSDDHEPKNLFFAVFKKGVLLKTDFSNCLDAENWALSSGYLVKH